MVPRSASSAVRVPPPTGAEVLEGELRDSAIGEGEEERLSKVNHFYILCFILLILGATSGDCEATGAAKLAKPRPKLLAHVSRSRKGYMGTLSDDENKSLSVFAAAVTFHRRNRGCRL